jgi:hypothetical protein
MRPLLDASGGNWSNGAFAPKPDAGIMGALAADIRLGEALS